ncbi:hypothetical protein GGI1_12490 [Acidithiobacillus sp. GGI-221]|nr:hypothetical protein GGI1_12490 [Acidithiobacillus sp. GGI-221]
MGALERFGLMVIGVLGIAVTLFLCIILLAWFGITELFLRMFPGLREKIDTPDYVPSERDG